GPHQIARPAAGVVPVDDPRVAFNRARDALLKEIVWNECPVRTPRERVKLDVRNAEPTRQLTRECRLARARRPDDRDAARRRTQRRNSARPSPYGFCFFLCNSTLSNS